MVWLGSPAALERFAAADGELRRPVRDESNSTYTDAPPEPTVRTESALMDRGGVWVSDMSDSNGSAMNVLNTRRAFQVFHAMLAIGLLVMSLTTLQHALHEIGDPGHGHLALVAALEAIGAVLLLVPRLVKWGGAALLVVLLPGFAYHVSQGHWALEHLIFAAGVWFVMAHGAAWGGRHDAGAARVA